MCCVRYGFVWSSLLFIAACAGSSAEPRSVLAIAPTQSLGWIGLAPQPTRTGDWLPIGSQALLVPAPVDGISPGIPLTAIGASGDALTAVSGSPSKIPYGCERNAFDAVVFTSKPLPSGPVWVLPRGAPATWHPRALGLELAGDATETRRVDHAGPVELSLTRKDATHGVLSIARDGRALLELPIERPAMAGVDAGPFDLSQHGVGVPVPVGAWSLVDGGPVLLFLRVAGYEGQRLRAVLVEATTARELPAMERYLYQCAV